MVWSSPTWEQILVLSYKNVYATYLRPDVTRTDTSTYSMLLIFRLGLNWLSRLFQILSFLCLLPVSVCCSFFFHIFCFLNIYFLFFICFLDFSFHSGDCYPYFYAVWHLSRLNVCIDITILFHRVHFKHLVF